ncbi:MAG: type II toxin-antitoxin system VapB family antitoxin [Microthrixaceae bacterium]
MAFSIKNDDADRLARELAAATGESLTEAVLVALRERLQREESRRRVGAADRLRRLAAEVATLPITDTRSPEEILAYDEQGVPT